MRLVNILIPIQLCFPGQCEIRFESQQIRYDVFYPMAG